MGQTLFWFGFIVFYEEFVVVVTEAWKLAGWLPVRGEWHTHAHIPKLPVFMHVCRQHNAAAGKGREQKQ